MPGWGREEESTEISWIWKNPLLLSLFTFQVGANWLSQVETKDERKPRDWIAVSRITQDGRCLLLITIDQRNRLDQFYYWNAQSIIQTLVMGFYKIEERKIDKQVFCVQYCRSIKIMVVYSEPHYRVALQSNIIFLFLKISKNTFLIIKIIGAC